MSVRINKACKVCDIGLQTAVEFLWKMGYCNIDANPNTKISEEQYELLLREFSKDKELRRQANAITHSAAENRKERISLSKQTIVQMRLWAAENFTDDAKYNRQLLNSHKWVELKKNVVAVSGDKLILIPKEQKASFFYYWSMQEISKNCPNNVDNNYLIFNDNLCPAAGKIPVEPFDSLEYIRSVGEITKGVFRLNREDQPNIHFAVKGNIDLSALNQSTRPKKKTKEEKRKEREERLLQNRAIIASHPEEDSKKESTPSTAHDNNHSERINGYDRICEAKKKNETVTCKVRSCQTGGLFVDLFGIEAFMPISQIDASYVSDTSTYKDEVLEVKILDIDLQNKRITVSHRAVVEKRVLANVRIGAELRATVKEIVDYGAFVKLEIGASALLPRKDIPAKRGKVGDVLKIGEEINVIVTDIKENNKITVKRSDRYIPKDADQSIILENEYIDPDNTEVEVSLPDIQIETSETNEVHVVDKFISIKKILDAFNRYTPDRIAQLEENEIFVFGTNKYGSQKLGAAGMAARLFGAQPGVTEGATGRSYAFPTKGFAMEDIVAASERFEDFVRKQGEKRFLVTPVGCGHAGFAIEDIAPLFFRLVECENVYLPSLFINYYNEHLDLLCEQYIPKEISTPGAIEQEELKDYVELFAFLDANGIKYVANDGFCIKDKDNNILAQAYAGTPKDKIVFAPINIQSQQTFKYNGFTIMEPEEFITQKTTNV